MIAWIFPQGVAGCASVPYRGGTLRGLILANSFVFLLTNNPQRPRRVAGVQSLNTWAVTVVTALFYAGIAQSEEHTPDKREVDSSSLSTGTKQEAVCRTDSSAITKT